jgi:hypothetical protein
VSTQSKGFLTESLGSLRYGIISSANKDNLTSSLPISIPLIYFSCLIVLAKNSNTILKGNGKSGYPYLQMLSVFSHMV